MSLYDVTMNSLDGSALDLSTLQGQEVLVVNVASKCGLTPQYTGLEELQKRYADRGFTVLGVPCNQFGGQEPGTADEIQTFCSTTYGVTFPMTEKVDVNGQARHPLYQLLTETSDSAGEAGDIQWNFENSSSHRRARSLPGSGPVPSQEPTRWCRPSNRISPDIWPSLTSAGSTTPTIPGWGGLPGSDGRRAGGDASKQSTACSSSRASGLSASCSGPTGPSCRCCCGRRK